MARTDIHRPSAINPTDYEYVACSYLKIESLGDVEVLRRHRERINKHMAHTGGKYSDHEHGGNCMVCGSVNAIYMVVFYHKATNTYIKVGTECAENLDRGEAKSFKKAIRDAIENKSGKAKAAQILINAGAENCWTIYETAISAEASKIWSEKVCQSWEVRTLTDIIGKLVKYGNISDRALSFAKSLADKIPSLEQQWKAIEDQRKAEHDAAEVITEGRQQIIGKVISIKESEFGFKILVQDRKGWKVYGNLPGNRVGSFGEYVEITKGSVIAFTATVQKSEKDEKFGFYKRPRNVKVVTDQEEADHLGF